MVTNPTIDPLLNKLSVFAAKRLASGGTLCIHLSKLKTACGYCRSLSDFKARLVEVADSNLLPEYDLILTDEDPNTFVWFTPSQSRA